MNLETVIADKIMEKVRALPDGKQEKILHFVEEIEREETNGNENLDQKKSKRFSFVGIARGKASDVSIRAEEILMNEIDKRSGWTLKGERID